MTATAAKLSRSITEKIADKVTDWTGNRFLDKHYVMIESRLTRRLIQLKLKTLEDYYNYLMEHEDDEKEHYWENIYLCSPAICSRGHHS